MGRDETFSRGMCLFLNVSTYVTGIVCEDGTPGYTSSFTNKLTSHLQEHFWLERACKQTLEKLTPVSSFIFINYFLLNFGAQKFKKVPDLLTKPMFSGTTN